VAMKALDAMAQADARELARYTDAGRRLESDLSAQKALQKETGPSISMLNFRPNIVVKGAAAGRGRC